MINKIAKREVIEIIRDKRIFLSSIIIVSLLIISMFVGFQYSSQRSNEQKDSQEDQYQHWTNKGEMNPHSAAHHGMNIFKPYSILSMVDNGIEKFTGTSVFLEAHKRNQFGYKSAEDSNNLQRFGDLTASSILQILIPLLIILIIFNSVNSERENGTLKQVLSIGVSKSNFINGKILGVFYITIFLLSPFILTGLILISTSSNPSLDDFIKYIILNIIYFIYFSIFVLFSFIVVSMVSSGRKAMIVLICFWFFTCFIIPKISMNIASYIYKTPTSFEFVKKIEKERESMTDWETRANSLKKEMLKKYNVKLEKDIPINIDGLVLISEEEDDTRIYNSNFNYLYDIYKKQNDIYKISAIFSPMVSMQLISTSLANTDFESFNDFNKEVEIYRSDMVSKMNSAIKDHKKTDDTFDYVAGKDLWEKVKAFNYSIPDYKFSLKNTILSLGILILWFLLLLISLPFAVRKIKVI